MMSDGVYRCVFLAMKCMALGLNMKHHTNRHVCCLHFWDFDIESCVFPFSLKILTLYLLSVAPTYPQPAGPIMSVY